MGFDFVVNVNESIGGIAGLKFIGYIEKAVGQKRITAKFHDIVVDKIKVYANLTSVKLNGEIEFKNETINGSTIKAAKGNLSAEFTTINAAVYAGAIFGRQTSQTLSYPVLPAQDFRFFMIQAKAILPAPGIPMLPGVAIRGIGAGFHKNMNATFPDSAPTSGNPSSSSLSSQTSVTSPVQEAVYPGVTFVPQYGTNGLKLPLEISATPK